MASLSSIHYLIGRTTQATVLPHTPIFLGAHVWSQTTVLDSAQKPLCVLPAPVLAGAPVIPTWAVLKTTPPHRRNTLPLSLAIPSLSNVPVLYTKVVPITEEDALAILIWQISYFASMVTAAGAYPLIYSATLGGTINDVQADCVQFVGIPRPVPVTTTEEPTTQPPVVTTTTPTPVNIEAANFAWTEVSAARRNARRLLVNHAWTLLMNVPGERIPVTAYERYIPLFYPIDLQGAANTIYYAIAPRGASYASRVYLTALALDLLEQSPTKEVADQFNKRSTRAPKLRMQQVYDGEAPALIQRLLLVDRRFVKTGLDLYKNSVELNKVYQHGCSSIDRAGCVVASLLLMQHNTYMERQYGQA